MTDSKTEELRKIRDEIVNFKTFPLYNYRIENNYFPVVGEGNHDAQLFFVGEAPGKNEAMTGRPFIGAAGRILTELIQSIGLQREDVYITSVVKDRPPENRDPTPEEIALHGPFLLQQIDIIQPKVLATLGRFSMAYLMQNFGLEKELQTISKIHGKQFKAQARYGEITIVPLYHPAVALYNGSSKKTLLEDFKILKSVIN